MGFFEVIENKPKKLKIKKNVDALEQVFNNYSYFGAEKHKFNQEIIEKYSNSDDSDDCLAVAISYLGEGASNRKNAIIYFEKYLLKPSSQQYFSDWFIFSSLANLNEKEYMFENAIAYLKKLIAIDNDSNCADYIRIGDILIKINIDKAIDYYENLKNGKVYYKNKKIFDEAYRKVLEKKKKGYVYRPRKRNK